MAKNAQLFQSGIGSSGAGACAGDAPKRKPFPSKKQTVNTDAGEWIVKDVNGKVMFKEAYPEVVDVPKVQLFQSVCVFVGGHNSAGASAGVAPKRKPFPSMKQTVSADAGEWIVKEVDGKRVFVAVSGFSK
jgi:hypothetical protein